MVRIHFEMGFSGENGDLGFNDLISKLEDTTYYPDLFDFAFNDSEISEERIQLALAQFVRSIQSFDSKYDIGREQVANNNQPFPNYTAQENMGKNLFMQAAVFDNQGSRINGGIGCNGCHRAPEFDIDPNSGNNGIITNANGVGTDFTNTRSPSLRDVVDTDGIGNGQFMHIGESNNLITVLDHYNIIDEVGNPNLDQRLRPNGIGQQLNLTQVEKDAVIAFIRTLSGTDVYTNEKWSDPFIE